jgi:uncharacterized membrane protein
MVSRSAFPEFVELPFFSTAMFQKKRRGSTKSARSGVRVATIIEKTKRTPYAKPLTPDLFEKLLSVAAVVLFACVLAAIWKGRTHWDDIPFFVWPHLLTITVAVGLTPVMLLRSRGTRGHRTLGWVWVTAMFMSAFLSMFLRTGSGGGFSIIHALSAFTMVQVPVMVWRARQHDVRRHRNGVRALVAGALLLAGFFTFPFDRLLGTWLFG